MGNEVKKSNKEKFCLFLNIIKIKCELEEK